MDNLDNCKEQNYTYWFTNFAFREALVQKILKMTWPWNSGQEEIGTNETKMDWSRDSESDKGPHGFFLNLFEIQAKDMHAQAQECLSQR